MIKDILRDFIKFRRTSSDKNNTISSDKNSESFTPDLELWQKILDFVRGDAISDEQLEELISALAGKENMSLVRQLKKEIEHNYDCSEHIRKKHPNITATEMQICCYIIQGKSSREMAELMGVEISTITSNRSRLRTKLELSRKRNLKVYLDSISRLKINKEKKKNK